MATITFLGCGSVCPANNLESCCYHTGQRLLTKIYKSLFKQTILLSLCTEAVLSQAYMMVYTGGLCGPVLCTTTHKIFCCNPLQSVFAKLGSSLVELLSHFIRKCPHCPYWQHSWRFPLQLHCNRDISFGCQVLPFFHMRGELENGELANLRCSCPPAALEEDFTLPTSAACLKVLWAAKRSSALQSMFVIVFAQE